MKISELEKQMYYSVGKNTEITLKNGTKHNGFCIGYTSSVDNDPEPAEINIENEEFENETLCLMENEIESIIIKD